MSSLTQSTFKPKISKSKSPESDEPRNLLKRTNLDLKSMVFVNKSKKQQNSSVSAVNQDELLYKLKYSCELKEAYSETATSNAGEDTTETSSTINPSLLGSPDVSLINPESPQLKLSEVDHKTVTKQTQRKRGKMIHSEYFCKASYLAGPAKGQMPSINF